MATVAEAFVQAAQLHRAGNLAQAEQLYRLLVQAHPAGHRGATIGLGVVLAQQGKFDEAATCLQELLRQQPADVEARYNLGIVLGQRGNFAEAAACFEDVLCRRPADAETHYNLGLVLEKQGKIETAIEHYRQTLRLRPDYADAHNNLGNALAEQGDLEGAIESCRRALALKADFPQALCRLVFELQESCRWQNLEELGQYVIGMIERSGTRPQADCVAPFIALTLAVPTTAQQQLQAAQTWAQRQLQAANPSGGPAISFAPKPAGSKITLGYLSGDFHTHATAHLVAELFEKHDRSRFAVYGYSYGRDDGSPMRQRLVKGFDRFVDLQDLPFVEAARRIAADGVDILVDLKGYTKGARTEILALRPAPVQVNFLVYPGTMGASFIDYIVVDDFIVPPDQQPFFAEKLVHLPGCYQVNDSRREIAARTPSRAECGLPDDGFVFCCFNNNFKITPAMFDVWMDLLKAVPGSVLWLLEGNRIAPVNLRKEAERREVAPQRLIFAPRQPTPEHLARHRLADLFLDTFPCNAHTTASDALWAGCPVLTLAGQTFVSRVAGSLLRALELPELIATSLDEYRSMALRLAGDRELLAGLRLRLNASRVTAPLFDAGRFAPHLEKAFATMWQMHLAGEKPRAFAVDI